MSTWPPHVQEAVTNADRPHTISTAYERGHQRPALTVYTFQNPETIDEGQKSPVTLLARPPLPIVNHPFPFIVLLFQICFFNSPFSNSSNIIVQINVLEFMYCKEIMKNFFLF